MCKISASRAKYKINSFIFITKALPNLSLLIHATALRLPHEHQPTARSP